MNALNASELALRFLGFRIDTNGLVDLNVTMPSGTLGLAESWGTGGPGGLLTDRSP